MTNAHVIPCGDLIEHEAVNDCPCGPTATLHQSGECGDVWIAVHHSLDGRELTEAP